MWESGGDNEDSGSGDYEYFDNETSSVQFSFTNVENNRSEESVIELPGIERDSDLLEFSGCLDFIEKIRSKYLHKTENICGLNINMIPCSKFTTFHFSPSLLILFFCHSWYIRFRFRQRLLYI